ncbi:MAG TPA: ABC transporter permease [Flavobacteriales bacterium]|nr:ABC transporter permease [Flavobacteriales bacterium]
MKPLKNIIMILVKITLISAALILFFSMMAGMYYKSAPTKVKIAVLDLDQTALSRSLIHNIKASQYFDITHQATDYRHLQKLVDEGKVDAGVLIPRNTYKDVLNKRNVNILELVNGTANPGVSKLALMMLNKIVMTMNMQMMMHLRVDQLGTIPNVRHPKKPPLTVSERVVFNPRLSMEPSMLPAFMGLAMQIVSMLIVLFGLMAAFKEMKKQMPNITQIRQLPVKALIPPYIISWIIVTTAISVAFFTTMKLFGVYFDRHALWNAVFAISLLVLAMETIAYFLVLNIKNGAVLAAIITLIVLPAFMYSGFLIPEEQMAHIPNVIGNAFPLRHYLKVLYAVFNRHQELYLVKDQINILVQYIVVFLLLAVISILFGQWERKRIIKKMQKNEQ